MPIIGREPPADIVIPAPQVSARHAEINALGNGRYQLVDLGSTNGTFVNGQRIHATTVSLHDVVSLGTFQINLSAYAPTLDRVQPNVAPQPAAPAQPVVPPISPQQQQAAVVAPVARAAVQPAPDPPPVVKQEVEPPHAKPGPDKKPALGQPGLGNEMAVALATQKSYVGKAFLCWFLYWLLYIPGLVMNLAWLSEAKKIKALTGQSPSGMGCLQFLLFKFVILPILVVILFIVTGGAFLSALMSMF